MENSFLQGPNGDFVDELEDQSEARINPTLSIHQPALGPVILRDVIHRLEACKALVKNTCGEAKNEFIAVLASPQ